MKRIVKTYLSQKPNRQGLLINALVLLIVAISSELYWNNWKNLKELAPANRALIFENGEFWRLFSATLVHSDLVHFVSNAYMLFFLGFLVYGYYGAKWPIILGFTGAALTNALTIYTYPAHVMLVGASGWVYWLAGFWFVLYGFVDRRHTVPQRILRILGISLVILFPTTFKPEVSYLAHFIGFVIGAFSGGIYFVAHRNPIRSHEVYKYDEEEVPPEVSPQ